MWQGYYQYYTHQTEKMITRVARRWRNTRQSGHTERDPRQGYEIVESPRKGTGTNTDSNVLKFDIFRLLPRPCVLRPDDRYFVNGTRWFSRIDHQSLKKREKTLEYLNRSVCVVCVCFLFCIKYSTCRQAKNLHPRTHYLKVPLALVLPPTYSRWTLSLPSCLWSLRIFPSLPGSRLSIFLSRCKFSNLTTRQPMVEFYLLKSPRFPLRKKEHPTLVRIELTTSALAGVQVTY